MPSLPRMSVPGHYRTQVADDPKGARELRGPNLYHRMEHRFVVWLGTVCAAVASFVLRPFR